ncbi:hypothetical protein [Streptomyces minutiscleroticus]|uniref:Secreted protein n=1 Tax=Streptomyces minutiscleroticus TaxID=68238 RepID=A0A918NN14_9ACTN|nr:hypothetical protein [Streptomyces minutiscleroticus]GGX82480.1 hypothetical protein GCM10010358_40830 [Streptomyces minutiscleroticus]
MASIRTARTVAAVAALPLVAALFAGVATADNGAVAGGGSNAGVATVAGSGAGVNNGNSSTVQQQAIGAGASNENNSAQVNGSGFTAIDQSDRTVAINFSELW